MLEDLYRINISDLKKAGLLTPGSTGAVFYKGHLILRLMGFGDYIETGAGYRIYLAREKCLKGEQVFFLCTDCGRKCRLLFGDNLHCRCCTGLNYRCQHQSEVDRLTTRLIKFQQKHFVGERTRPYRQSMNTYINNLIDYCQLRNKQLNELQRISDNLRFRLLNKDLDSTKKS